MRLSEIIYSKKVGQLQIERSRGAVEFQIEEIRVDRGIISLLMVQR